MKNIKFLFAGVAFGIVMSKSQAISWYRIFEMFKFQSFHMYGIIGSAVAVGLLIMFLFRRGYIKNRDGELILVPPKKNRKISKYIWRYYLWLWLGFSWRLSWANVHSSWIW